MEPEPAADAGEGHRDLVVIGASAGGVETLKRIVSDLPPDLAASVCIVLHIAPASPSALAGILHRAGRLPCRAASDGDPLALGEIIVAPPDRHLIIEDGRVRLTIGPRENNHRPAVDALFRSSAVERGRLVIGVVLSGTRDDGTAGLALIKSHGGAAIVQDPSDALYPGMPTSALEHVAVDAVVPSHEIAKAIAAMVNGQDLPPHSDSPASGPEPKEADKSVQNPPARPPNLAELDKSVHICPECGGVLREHREAGVDLWECRVGHRYSPDTLADAQADGVEAALWTGIRALTDRSRLLHRLADRADTRGRTRTGRSFRRRAELADEQAELVRGALTRATQTALRKLGDDERDVGENEDDAA